MAALLAVSTSCRAPQGRAGRKLTCTCEAHAWCAGWYSTLRTVWRQRALRALPSNGVGYHAISAERHSVGRVTGTIALLVVVTSAQTPSLAGVQQIGGYTDAMKILAPVFLYPTWPETIGQPDPLASDYVGLYRPLASTTASASTPTPTSTSSTSPDTNSGTPSSDSAPT